MIKSMIVTIDPMVQEIRSGGGTRRHGTAVQKQDMTLKLEPELWQALEEICWREQSTVHAVCTAVYMTGTTERPLDAAMRLFILDYFRCAATEEGHWIAGHGLTAQNQTIQNQTRH